MNKNKAFSKYISKYFLMHPSRINLMSEITLSLIKVGSVQLQKIAQGTKIKAKTSSIIRRIQRFFEQQKLCKTMAGILLFNLFDWPEKIILTLDRTNWKFGKTNINFLVLCAIYKNNSIPICWILLPHRGNSQTQDRINLIEKLLLIIPINRIKFLLADREFIGEEWFHYLQTKGIHFCIRIKENMLVHDTRRGGKIKLKKLFSRLKFGEYRELYQTISRNVLRISATRMATGELLILAIGDDGNLLEAFELYKNRWTIETMFKAFKSAGFNFEQTHQKNLERLDKMMILLAISYSWAVRIGEIKNNFQPIKIKIHGRLEFSLFSYGFRTIQTILLKGINIQKKLFKLLEKIALNQTLFQYLMEITVVY